MNEQLLRDTVSKLLEKGKGILAADESNGTSDKRLELAGISGGEENRRRYRDLLLCTPDLDQYISGVILYEETFWQKPLSADNQSETFASYLTKIGILPGIKLDTGAKDFPGYPGEKITRGLDDLSERAAKFSNSGAKFAKWRAVITIDEVSGIPSEKAITANVEALAEYASIVQSLHLVPIVEPEVLLTGKHSIEKSEEVTTKVVSYLFRELTAKKVFLPGLILKTSMVISGDQNPEEADPQEVADRTIRMLKTAVPKETGGVVFLSGGQTPVEATAHFDAIAEQEPLPWPIAFSYARAIQDPALKAWAGRDQNILLARSEFLKRLELNKLADSGDYDISLEYLD